MNEDDSSELRSAEWVAQRMDAIVEGVTDPGYLMEVKATVIEILGDRLYDYRGRDRLRDYLKARGYSPESGFPDNPGGCVHPAVSGSPADLSSYEALNGCMEAMMNRAYAERDRIQAEVMSRPVDRSVLDGVDPALIERFKRAVEAEGGAKALLQRLDRELEEETKRSRTARDAARAAREAEEKAADIASYPKREDWA